VRATAGQLHPTTGDRRDPGTDPLSQEAHRARTSEIQPLAKVLADSGIKIDSVASSLTALSTRGMIEALIAGERDPPCWPAWLVG
jgi:hypothetical protein